MYFICIPACISVFYVKLWQKYLANSRNVVTLYRFKEILNTIK